MNRKVFVVLAIWIGNARFAPFWPGYELRSNGLLSGYGGIERHGTGPRIGPAPDAASVALAQCLRSFRRDGVRPTDLARELARHRSLSAWTPGRCLPHGHPGPGDAHQFGLRQRASRLAGVRRRGGVVDAPDAAVVCRRAAGIGTGGGPVRPGCDRDRTEPGALPVGAVAKRPRPRSSSA